MSNISRFGLFLLLASLLPFFQACSTQKVRGEYTGIKKVYHNTTQRYNGYFNATVLLEESKIALDQQHVDNYNRILAVYPYTEAENPQAVAEPLDEAMKKVSVAVNLHRGANWTDDCYLLLGQAQYLKQDYETAEETFEFMEVEFSNDLRKRGSLSQRARDREKKTKAEKEQYKKERMKEIREEREARDDKRAADKKAREKAAKAKKKARIKERKQREKEMKAYKKAVAKARRAGTKPPPRPSSRKKTEKPAEVEKKEEVTEEEKKEKPEEKEEVAEDKPNMLEEPESYFLKHRPALREAMLWLARTYTERRAYGAADRKFAEIEQDPRLSKEVAAQIPAARAHFFMEQKKYDEALPWLEKAIEVEEDRTLRARYAFIIAQIENNKGNVAAAQKGFERVIGFRPAYEMDFAARLNLINSRYAAGNATAEATDRELQRLLKDLKNEEYQDQIYYTLAQIAFQGDREDEAIGFLE